MLCHIAIWGLIDENTPGSFRTLDEIFTEGMRVGKDAPFLGERKIISRNPLKYAPAYTWITYGQADIRRRYIGSALHALFQKGELGSGEYPTVGIWSQNRPGSHIFLILCSDTDSSNLEWQLIDIAAASYQKVSVSLYDTLGSDSVGEWDTECSVKKPDEAFQNTCKVVLYSNFKLTMAKFSIHHANLTVVFTTTDHVPKLLELKSKVPTLKMIVTIDDISTDAAKLLNSWAASLGVVFQELADCAHFKYYHCHS